MNRSWSWIAGQLLWIAASASFVAVLISAVTA
jgi:hypothetical protein